MTASSRSVERFNCRVCLLKVSTISLILALNCLIEMIQRGLRRAGQPARGQAYAARCGQLEIVAARNNLGICSTRFHLTLPASNVAMIKWYLDLFDVTFVGTFEEITCHCIECSFRMINSRELRHN